MAEKVKITWLKKPEEHDYPAAISYLSLLYDEKFAVKKAEELRRADMARFKAKDIFRASGLPLLKVSNFHVKKDQKKILSKENLSPLLLVRDTKNGKLVIADGYHRMCAVCFYDEDAVIPCKIV